MFASLAFRQEDFRFPRSALAVGLLIVALGLLQFSYLMFTKKEARLGDGVLYIASVAFMIFGAFAAASPFIAPSEGTNMLNSARGAGVFFIGLLVLAYARKRKRQNQSSQPTPTSRHG
jgi:membrane associated rhomboid family serine protease